METESRSLVRYSPLLFLPFIASIIFPPSPPPSPLSTCYNTLQHSLTSPPLEHSLSCTSGRPLVKPKLVDFTPKLQCSKNASDTASPTTTATAPSQNSQSNLTAPSSRSDARRLLYAPLPCTSFGSVITHHGRHIIHPWNLMESTLTLTLIPIVNPALESTLTLTLTVSPTLTLTPTVDPT